VTRAQFNAFLTATGYRPKDSAPSEFTTSADTADEVSCTLAESDWTLPAFEQTETDPVVCVSWEDARAYIGWLNQSTGLEFRLPTAREWEYAASAGATTRYWFGDVHDPSMGNGPGTGGADRWPAGTAPVSQFPANPFGLMDMVGNAAEWVAECPDAASAGTSDPASQCTLPAVRGNSWKSGSTDLAETGSRATSPTHRAPDLGFRLATGP
jgi:formylglycine-generating enzyme required for sulfatase activity